MLLSRQVSKSHALAAGIFACINLMMGLGSFGCGIAFVGIFPSGHGIWSGFPLIVLGCLGFLVWWKRYQGFVACFVAMSIICLLTTIAQVALGAKWLFLSIFYQCIPVIFGCNVTAMLFVIIGGVVGCHSLCSERKRQPSAGVVFQPSNAPTAPQVIGHPGPDMPYYPQQPTGYPLHPPEYVNHGASFPPAQVDKPMM